MADAPPSQESLAAAVQKLLTEDPLFALGEAEIRGNTYGVFANAPKSLVGLFMYGAAHGEKDFMLFEDERLSFAETWRRACRFAHALKNELDVRQGDRVAIAMRNYPEWCISYMAIISLGAVVVPLNAWWKTEELCYGLEDCEAKIVVVDYRRLEYLRPIKERLDLTLILARSEASDGADYLYDDLLLAGAAVDSPPEADIEPDDDFCIVYTSGSTGSPKGAILTHRGCITTILSWALLASAVREVRGENYFGDNPGILLGIPLFHVTGSHSIFLLSYVVGRRMAIMYRWDPEEAVRLINKEKLTNFVGVPSQSYELMEAAGDDELPSLIDIGSGGAKRPPEHVKMLAEKFKSANASSGYGLTETNALGCIITQDDYLEHPDSTGRVVPPVTQLKIMKEDGEEAAPCEVGEIWIRTAANFRGYLNNPEETARTITSDGWFKTGDLGKIDEEGFVTIVDRIKDLIIRGGENISCIEVENRAYEFSKVAEASAFSVPDNVLGERVGLVVFPRKGAEIDPHELRDFMARELAGFKVPERIWISPAPLPRLGTAKIDKITVKTIALQHPPALVV
ncbi:MAG: class I adenylate-forming enzyme family protein [Parvularculaceae bacterium]